MASISQTTFSNSLSWMKMYEFCSIFLWRFVPMGPINTCIVQIMAWCWHNPALGVLWSCARTSAGPCLTTAIWRCRKNSSQWQRSFQWKLHSHWLKFLWQRHVAVVRQGPGLRLLYLGADLRVTSHYLNKWWLVYWRIYVSLGFNELTMFPVMTNFDLDLRCHMHHNWRAQ